MAQQRCHREADPRSAAEPRLVIAAQAILAEGWRASMNSTVSSRSVPRLALSKNLRVQRLSDFASPTEVFGDLSEPVRQRPGFYGGTTNGFTLRDLLQHRTASI